MKSIAVFLFLFGLLATHAAASCICHHNRRRIKWQDYHKTPAQTAYEIIHEGGGGCRPAPVRGTMCAFFTGDEYGIKHCITEYAFRQQTHKDQVWHQWSAIHCSDNGRVAAVSITKPPTEYPFPVDEQGKQGDIKQGSYDWTWVGDLLDEE